MGLGYVQLNLLKTRGWVRFLQCAAFKQVFCGVDWNGVKYEIRAWNILLIKDILKLTKVPKSTYLQFLGMGLQDFFFFFFLAHLVPPCFNVLEGLIFPLIFYPFLIYKAVECLTVHYFHYDFRNSLLM